MGFIVFPYLYFLFNKKKIKNQSKYYQFVYGVFFGIGLNIVVLHWVKEPFLFNTSTKNFSFLSFLLILYVSIYFGIVFLILSFFKNRISNLLMIPVVFIISEIIRENFLFGFPWVTFALISSANYYLLQIVYFIGTNALSFILIFLFLTPVCFMMLKRKEAEFFSKTYIGFSLLFFIIIILLISLRLLFYKNYNQDNKIHFSLNQLNISQSLKSNISLKKMTIEEITNIIKNQKNTIHIFSETDYPYIIENNNIVDIFQKNLSNNNSIVIGGIRKDNKRYYNSLYLITKNNFDFFDKKKLVPFGEFLPFRNKLSFLEAIVGTVDLEKGKRKRLIKSDYNFNFIPVICYEIIFFNDLLSDINNNSPILINITNDAWFGNFSGPYQHFYLSRLRSVEFNKFLVRVSNNGVSAIINNYGKIIKFLPLNEKKSINININVPKELNNFYSFHKGFYLVLFIIVIVAIVIEKRFKKL